MTTVTADNFANIHDAAIMAAKQAATTVFNEKLGGHDQFACGFAWVKIMGVRGNTKLGKAIIAAGFRKSYDGGYDLWNPSGLPVQNIDCKAAGADAYAKILQDAGLTVYAQSRLD